VTENLNGAVYRHIQGQLSRKYRILILNKVIFEGFGESGICE
jgi:hypothetical protein